MLKLSYQAEVLFEDELCEVEKSQVRVTLICTSIVLNKRYKREKGRAEDLPEEAGLGDGL